jgi:hypothetical protein
MEWINLVDYTVLQHVLFATGCLGWVVVYLLVIKAIREDKFVEVPIIAITANFAWEFLWSFVFKTNMGELYVWGYRLWFFLDCFIVGGTFLYGSKQIDIPALKSKFKGVFLFSIASWFVILYYYIKEYDLPLSHMGAYSGYILNVMMSAMYIPLYLRIGKQFKFSLWGAWLKGVGTFLISIFCFLKFEDKFLLGMCVITAILDAFYIYYVAKKK